MADTNDLLQQILRELQGNGRSTSYRGSVSVPNAEASPISTQKDLDAYLRRLERGKSGVRDFINTQKDLREENEKYNESLKRSAEAQAELEKKTKNLSDAAKENEETLLKYYDVYEKINQINDRISNGTATAEETAQLKEYEKTLKSISKELRANGYRGKQEKTIAKEAEQVHGLSENYKEIAKTRQEQATVEGNIKSLQEEQGRHIQRGIDAIKRTYNVAKSLAETWGKIDQAAANYAKSVGLSAQGMANMRDRAMGVVNSRKLGINYNMSAEELIKAQETYSNEIGRNIGFNENGQENLAAMTAVMGDRAGSMMTKLENFGLSVTDAAKKSGEMFKTASDYGISFEKYSKNFVDNLAIAQNYTFRNGLKGLEDMAKKATAIKLDMQAVQNFASKVQTLEGAMDASARLQVLGGSFSALSDPLSMMNEGLNDMEGLFDRVAGMIKGMGTMNENGEVVVSSTNKRKIAAAAQAMGINSDQLMESVNAQARRGEIERQLNIAGRGDLNDKTRELILNSGVFEHGKAGVNIDGKFVSIDQISNKDQDILVKETQSQSDDIKDIARMLRGAFDVREGLEKQRDNLIAGTVGGVIGRTLKTVSDKIGTSNVLLTTLVAVQTVGQLFPNLGGTLGGKFANFLSKRGGTVGKVGNFLGGTGGSAASTAASTSAGGGVGSKLLAGLGSKALTVGAGVAAGAAAIYGGAKWASSAERKRQENLSNGGRIGDSVDKSQTRQKSMGTGLAIGGGVGAAAGIAVGLTGMKIGATLGSFAGPVGAAAGALLGIAAGAIVGGIQAKTREAKGKLQKAAEKAGVEIIGDYGRKDSKKITEALATGKIDDKTRKKLAENGEIELLDAIDKRKDTVEKRDGEAKPKVDKRYVDSAIIHVNSAVFEGVSFKPVSLKGPGNGGISGRYQEVGYNTSSGGENTFNLNVNGTIRLDTGGKSINITDAFVKELVSKIVQQRPELLQLGKALDKTFGNDKPKQYQI